jgi:hypothetical protein
VSNEIGSLLVGAERIIVPYETIAGSRQVSSFVIVFEGRHEVFSLSENDKDIGPVKLNRVDLSQEKIASWLEQRQDEYEEISPKDVRVTMWSFPYEGTTETVIYAIDLLASDGRKLRMSRDGAAYPYSLALQDGT